MSTTVVVAREFRGARLYLVSAKTLEFTWTANRAKALPLSVAVALRIMEECEDFARGTDAFAIDKNDCIIARVDNGSIVLLRPSTYVPRFYDDVLQKSVRGEWLDFATIKCQSDADMAVGLVREGVWDGERARFRIRRERKETMMETV